MDQDEFKSLLSDYLDVDSMEKLFPDDMEPEQLDAPLNNYFGDDFFTLLSRNTDLLPERLVLLQEALRVVGDETQPKEDRAMAAVGLGQYIRKYRGSTSLRLQYESTPDQWFTLAAELESTLGACELANEHLADKNLIITLGRQHGLLPQISYKDKSNNDLVAIVCEPATQAWALGIRLALRQTKAELCDADMRMLDAAISCIVNWLTLWSEREKFAYRQAAILRFQSLDWIEPLWNKLIEQLGEQCSQKRKQQLLDQQLATRLLLENESQILERTEKRLKPVAPNTNEETDDHVIVISGVIPPSTDRGDNTQLWRYRDLQEPVKLTCLPNIEHLHAIRHTLEEEFPWALDPISIVMSAFIARRRHGSIRLGMPPLLLVGKPGTGKTRFAQRLSELLGTPSTVINMAGMHDVNVLKGVSRGWAGNRPSRIVEFIQQASVANPLFILDEVDKAQVGSFGNGGKPHDALLDLLEPGNAQRYTDMYLMTECDLSHCLYVLTCNSLRALPEPLLSRVRMVFFPAPSEEHAHVITQGICRDMERAWSIPAGSLDLSPADRASLVGLKPREMKWALFDLFGRYANATAYTLH